MQPGSSSTHYAKGINQATVLDWIDAVRESARTAPWTDLVRIDGVEVLDILLAPIYLSVLNALRNRPTHQESSPVSLFKRVYEHAYWLKTDCLERVAAGKSVAPGRTDFLLWTRHKTHTEIFQPVGRALAEQGESCRILACQANVFNELLRHDPIPTFTLGAWPLVVREARREGARRAQQLARFGNWQVPEFPDKQAGDLEAAVRSTVVRLMPLAQEAIANVHAAINAYRPKVLVVGNDITLEGRSGCRVAAKLGVTTATFMHGSISGDPLHARHCVDRLLVHGNSSRRELVQHGFPPERIVACGAPGLDSLPRQSGQTHPLLQARLGIRPDEPWILVATSGPGHRISHQHHQLVIDNLVRLSSAMPNLPIVVKLHPKDRMNYYRQIMRKRASAKLFVLPHDASGYPQVIFDWLQGCRLVLTGASMVAIEAMLMEVPVITMDFWDEIHQIDFIEAGATSHVRSLESLDHAVREVLAAGGQCADVKSRVRSYLGAAFGALDGRSASRGAQALRELAEAQETPIHR